MELSFAQLLRNTLKCRSCSIPLVPPISQCSWGHQHCSACSETLGECSRGHPSSEMKISSFIERLCFEILMKCSYSDNGCTITGNAIVVAQHEDCCRFSRTPILPQSNPEEESAEDTKQHSDTSDSKTIKKAQSVARSQLQVFLAEFECPVCFGLIPTMEQCINDHKFCISCFDRVDRCPLCRGPPKSCTYNVFLEHILLEMKVPCYNAKHGCRFRGNSFDIYMHERPCGFVRTVCLLPDKCTWEGWRGDIFGHCHDVHTEWLKPTSNRKWILENFISNDEHTISCIFFYLDGVLFRGYWFKLGKEVIFFVNHYCVAGAPMYAYIYEMYVYFPNSDDKIARTRTRWCIPLANNGIKFSNKNCLKFSLDYLMRYCDDDSNLPYGISVGFLVRPPTHDVTI